ncbi:alginate export family protein [Chitinophaga sp.]|uniref:alginate export family protein n=1 Tax=Chitinophaga sp. TaxID=1869181 RepID=UPI0031D55D8D
MKRAFLCILALFPLLTYAQDTIKKRPVPKFLPLNYEEDYRYLSNKELRTGLWAKLKYIPLWQNGYITIGGEIRPRVEYREHLKYGKGNEDQGFDWQQRSRLWADIHILPNLRVFGEVQSGTTYELDYNPSLTDYNPGEIHQAFAEYTVNLGAGSKVYFRVGRQEILFNKARLFDVRQPPNNRHSFDAGRIGVKLGAWNFGVIGGEEVQDKAGYFNDPSNKNLKFGAAHVSRLLLKNSAVELLYIYTDKKGAANAMYNGTKNTLSARIGGIEGSWNYDVELVGQSGKNKSGQQVHAWYVATESCYTFKSKWKPFVGTRIDIASGDKDSTDNKSNSYDYLWSKGMSWVSDLGYTNIAAVGPTCGCKPTAKLSIDFTVQELWRTSKEDGIYAMSGIQLRSAGAGTSCVIGTRCVAKAEYQLNPFLMFGAYVNETFKGEYLKQAGSSQNMVYAHLYSVFRF